MYVFFWILFIACYGFITVAGIRRKFHALITCISSEEKCVRDFTKKKKKNVRKGGKINSVMNTWSESSFISITLKCDVMFMCTETMMHK